MFLQNTHCFNQINYVSSGFIYKKESESQEYSNLSA